MRGLASGVKALSCLVDHPPHGEIRRLGRLQVLNDEADESRTIAVFQRLVMAQCSSRSFAKLTGSAIG
jgi:hypothetical protein